MRQLRFDVRQFIFRHLQNQFVMHLHDQLGGRLFGGQSSLHFNHGAFDQVGCGALHGCVNGGAFSCGTTDGTAVDVGQIQTAAEQGFHIAQTACLLFGTLHIFCHARVACKITLDEHFRRHIVNAEGFGQPEAAHAVNQAEVDGFGVAALLCGDVFGRHAEDFGGGAAVHVFVVLESSLQGRVAGKVRHNPQFDLRIVG